MIRVELCGEVRLVLRSVRWHREEQTGWVRYGYVRHLVQVLSARLSGGEVCKTIPRMETKSI